MSEQIETSSKKGRGRARKSLDLIEAMFEIAHGPLSQALDLIAGRS